MSSACSWRTRGLPRRNPIRGRRLEGSLLATPGSVLLRRYHRAPPLGITADPAGLCVVALSGVFQGLRPETPSSRRPRILGYAFPMAKFLDQPTSLACLYDTQLLWLDYELFQDLMCDVNMSSVS